MKTIYGECISGEVHAAVTISRLGREDCELVVDPAGLKLDAELALWIGAIGPLAISQVMAAVGHGRTTRRDRHLTARFDQPLDPAILAHFAA